MSTSAIFIFYSVSPVEIYCSYWCFDDPLGRLLIRVNRLTFTAAYMTSF